MSAHFRRAERASELFEESLASPRPVTEASRAAAVDVLVQAMRAEERRRARTSTLRRVAFAASFVLVGFGVAHLVQRQTGASTPREPAPLAHGEPSVARPLDGEIEVVRDGVTSKLSSTFDLRRGDHIRASHGRASVTLPTGTHVVVEDRSELAIVESGAAQIFALESGAMRADVAKLKASERFVVRTGDAEIEVRGTAFRVERDVADRGCARAAGTRVTVLEGVVTVRDETSDGATTYVHAGEAWPSCAPPTFVEPAPSAFNDPRATVHPPAAKAHGGKRPSTSELAAQNDFFVQALAAKKRGDRASAVATFDRFLREYPASPLVENAMVERMRLLVDADPAAGSRAARDYLARYPRGYAYREAAAIVALEP